MRFINGWQAGWLDSSDSLRYYKVDRKKFSDKFVKEVKEAVN
jgi:hypothetical protein